MTRKAWQLSAQAFASLEDIGEWSKDHFGDRQADAYLDLLIAQCDAVAEGLAHHQSRRDIFAADLREDLRFTRIGQHYVVFVETDLEVLVVDFVHQRMDLGRVVKG